MIYPFSGLLEFSSESFRDDPNKSKLLVLENIRQIYFTWHWYIIFHLVEKINSKHYILFFYRILINLIFISNPFRHSWLLTYIFAGVLISPLNLLLIILLVSSSIIELNKIFCMCSLYVFMVLSPFRKPYWALIWT